MMMIVLLLFISQHASGVEVYEGAESVLLPCQVPADVSRNSTAAVWRREWLGDVTVHLRRQKSDDLDEHDDLSGQNKLYKHRTSMRVDALQTGDLSLTLRNPTVFDSGTYNCSAVSFGDRLRQSEVQLKVTVPPPPPPVWPKVLSAVLGTLIILAAAFGLFVCCACKRMKDKEALQPEVVEEPQGEKSVLLPFKTTAVLPQNVRVEWTYSYMKVHVYESGNNKSDKQHQGYRGRTEMDEDPLRTKDLSLTLKHLHVTDSGEYTCTVSDKHGHMLLQKVVTLRVREMEMVVTQGLKFVVLPFTVPHDLPQGTTVEWRHNYVTVYKYTDGNVDSQYQVCSSRTEMHKDPLRTKDLSLILKDLHLTDSGVYTCTVSHKHGYMLLQRVVTLRVRDNEVEVVEVTLAKESVLLPFKITADLPEEVTVEWTRSDSKHTKVYVFQKSQSQPDKQHQGYRGRAEMDEDALITKDLSLTLKDLHLTDSGVYTCTVYNKYGHMLLQKSVTLSVKETLMGAMADMLACLRRRRAPKSEIKVEKRNMNQEDVPLMEVHSG